MQATIKLVPIYKENEIILYDMFVNGEWLGSRRTIEACEHVLDGCHYEIVKTLKDALS